MSTHLDAIHARRRVLQNPYAFMEQIDEEEAIRRDKLRLENPYAHVEEIERQNRPIQRFDGIGESSPAHTQNESRRHRSSAQLETLVRSLQVDLWSQRESLFGTQDLDPIQVLDPVVALKLLGFQVIEADSLGQFSVPSGIFEVAGSIDRDRMQVHLSTQFPSFVRRFTLAHELGHAALHNGLGLHRDLPLDGAKSSSNPVEAEANRFATIFLLPTKQVVRAFAERFGTELVQFHLAATFGKPLPIDRNSRRMAARRLASMTNFGGASFRALHEVFGVSVECLAIRLEELGLFALLP